MITIRPGTTLSARSACDRECVFRVQILERRGSMVTLREMGQEKRCRVKVRDGEEYVQPARYSMAPVFRAGSAQAGLSD